MKGKLGAVLAVALLVCGVGLAQTKEGIGKQRVKPVTLEERVKSLEKQMGGFTDKQRSKITKITADYNKELEGLAKNREMKESEKTPQVRKLQDKYDKDIRACLSPAQKKKWDQIIADRKKRLASTKGGFGSPTQKKP